jgi:hypothetical protein
VVQLDLLPKQSKGIVKLSTIRIIRKMDVGKICQKN